MLSEALLEHGTGDQNLWNRRQHELSLARKAMRLSQARLSRAQAWSQIQSKFLGTIRTENPKASDADYGVRAVQTYSPNTGKTPQVVLFHEDGVRLGVVCSVFRGSIIRKMDSKHFNQVRIAKPVSTPLPAECARMVHILPAHEHADKNAPRWICSCLDVPVLVEPTNVVLGEVKAEVRASATRLHIMPSVAAMHAIKQMSGMRVPYYDGVPSSAVEQDEAVIPDAAVASGCERQFSDRSFMKRKMAENVQAFLRGVYNAYKAKGIQVTDVDGFTKLKGSSGRVAWTSLLEQAPSYFEKVCGDLAGYKYSQAIHAHLIHLLPKQDRSLAFIVIGLPYLPKSHTLNPKP